MCVFNTLQHLQIINLFGPATVSIDMYSSRFVSAKFRKSYPSLTLFLTVVS